MHFNTQWTLLSVHLSHQSQQGVGCSHGALHCTHLMTIYDVMFTYSPAQEAHAEDIPARFNMDKVTDCIVKGEDVQYYTCTNMYVCVLTSYILFISLPALSMTLSVAWLQLTSCLCWRM